MKRFLLLLMVLMPMVVSAQLSLIGGRKDNAKKTQTTLPPVSENAFQGDLDIKLFTNYCDYINKNGLVAGGNGVHKQKLTLKGHDGKLVDETTGIVTIWNIPKGVFVTFIPEKGKGLSYEGNIDSQLTLAPRDTKIYGKYDQKLLSNTVTELDGTTSLNGKDCKTMKGTMVREQGGMKSKYGIKAIYDPETITPPAISGALYGLEVPGMPLFWSHSYDGGHVAMAGGELSYYMDGTVEKATPREVSDSEFEIPSNIKFTKSSNPMKMMGYLKDANKYAIQKIAEDKKNGHQSEYDSFRTSDEWDY